MSIHVLPLFTCAQKTPCKPCRFKAYRESCINSGQKTTYRFFSAVDFHSQAHLLNRGNKMIDDLGMSKAESRYLPHVLI